MTRNLITISNPDTHDLPTTSLSQDVAVGGTTLTVTSSSGFSTIVAAATYYYLLIGAYGTEKSEIVLASAKTDTTFTVGACKFSHSSSDPVTYLPYNQVKFYGRVTTGGSNNLLATVDIDCSNQATSYEYTGTTYYYFVSSYYRSDTTAEESGFSDEISFSSFSAYSAKKIIEAGLRKAMTRVDENQNGVLGWNICIDLLNEGLNEILTRKKKWQRLHKIDTSISTVASTAYISKPTDLSVLEFIYVDGKKIDYITKFRYNQLITANQGVTSGLPYQYTIKNDKIYLYPTPDAVYTTQFEYYSTPTVITSLTQEVIQEFSTILVYFIAAQAAYIRNNEKRGNLMEVKYSRVLENQIEDVTGEEQSGDSQMAEVDSIMDYDND